MVLPGHLSAITIMILSYISICRKIDNYIDKNIDVLEGLVLKRKERECI